MQRKVQCDVTPQTDTAGIDGDDDDMMMLMTTKSRTGNKKRKLVKTSNCSFVRKHNTQNIVSTTSQC